MVNNTLVNHLNSGTFIWDNNAATPALIRNNILNVAIDAVIYGAIAWKLWPRERDG